MSCSCPLLCAAQLAKRPLDFVHGVGSDACADLVCGQLAEVRLAHSRHFRSLSLCSGQFDQFAGHFVDACHYYSPIIPHCIHGNVKKTLRKALDGDSELNNNGGIQQQSNAGE